MDIDISIKFHRDLICRFDVMVNALLQDYRKMAYPRVYGEVDLHCNSTYPTKFDGHIE